MDATAEREMCNNRRQIPPEIVESILIHLPLKPLHRFSRVSKWWRSLISEPSFTKKRAAVRRDVCRLLMSRHLQLDFADASSCPLSSISAGGNPVKVATPVVFPIEGEPILRASCGDQLLCVEVNNSLYLWNPSINTYKKLPDHNRIGYRYFYGSGYDSVSDDYKILKFGLSSMRYQYHKSWLYSLRSDSWRMIDYPPFLAGEYIRWDKCVFAGGALLWRTIYQKETKSIISFDLATEKYEIIAPPVEQCRWMDLSALRGKLCAYLCWYQPTENFQLVIWVMEDCGIKKSWTKIFDTKIADGLQVPRYRPVVIATPLYLFDNGEILFRVVTIEHHALFMYKGEETRPWKMICRGVYRALVYDESLFSPLQFEKVNVAKKQDDLQG